ncbi:aspartyl protease family protein 2 [Canna indica]|uniref:Aspartyl protease family protein 2 n=1 Tax=Canna indica TaxID=4628 RepID=A0AAQ3KU24_9LILI|nr:aspartyl protease family protein 2 [Canna indica]
MSLLQSLLFLLILFSHAASVHLPIFRRSSPRFAEEEAVTAQRRSGFSNQVFSGYYLNSGIYYTRIGIGTPPTYIDLELDTGSDMIWIQCDPCPRCYKQVNSSSVFKPYRSRSYVPARCGDHLCHHLNGAWCESYGPSCPQNFSYGAGCDARSQSCLFMTSYNGGLSNTTGEFATETLTSGKGVHLPGIALGCAHDMYRISSAGILGLGRGSLSFSSQLLLGSMLHGKEQYGQSLNKSRRSNAL